MQRYGIIALDAIFETDIPSNMQKQELTLNLYRAEWLILQIIFQY